MGIYRATRPTVLSVGLAVIQWGCTCDGPKGSKGSLSSEVTVVRVESGSPERPGAEHCDDAGKNCTPLAPQQKIARRGVVRTYFGGKVSLDFGGGRRIDLGPNSQTALGGEQVSLSSGDFSLTSTPLVEKEPASVLEVAVAGKVLATDPKIPTQSNLSVHADGAILTMERGFLSGLFSAGSKTQAGQSVRFDPSGTFYTDAGGTELPQLGPVVLPSSEFGGLLPKAKQSVPRGLGTMSARLPNTDQVRDGVHLAKHHVRVVISDGFARTEVEEEFANTSPHVLEGRYRFPVPGDASLSRLALWVGDELIEGEVLEKKQAAAIYASIVDRPVPRDPALLEWLTGGEMSLKVFPILPQKSRKVILAYNQALSTEGGTLRYVYPLSLGEGRHTPIEDLSISVHVADSRAELKNPKVLGYKANLGREGRYHTARLALTKTIPTEDFVFSIERTKRAEAQLSTYIPSISKPTTASSPLGGLSTSPWLSGDSGAFGHFALRVSSDLPKGFERPVPGLLDRAIVLDVSQSQSKETILAQGALAFAMLRDLGAEERYVILACDSGCTTYPERGVATATYGHLDRARDFLLELTLGGSSDLAGALATAARRLTTAEPRQHGRQVVVMSDGQPSSGELSVTSIAEKVAPLLADVDLRFIGAGRTVDDDVLMGLAGRLGATVDPLVGVHSLERRLVDLALTLRRPVIKNVRLTLPPHMKVSESELLPALRLGQEVVVTGTLASPTGGEVTLEGQLAGSPYRLSLPLTVAEDADSQNPLVPRLWARSEIKRLQAAPPTPEIAAEIVDLSRKYRTMSRHTSFLVLESDKMYEDFGIQRTSLQENDQADSSFSDLKFDASTPSDDAVDPLSVTSFEQLEDAEEARKDGALAERKRESAASSPARPASRPAPSPKPSGAAPKGDLGDLLGWGADKSVRSGGGSGSVGRGTSTSGEASGSGARNEGAAPEAPADLMLDPLGPPWPQRSMPLPRRAPRAHLTFTAADEAWRSWGEKNITLLNESLTADPESRARLEAFIRGHLQFGRFPVARKTAERFVELDPDYAPARQLLAYAAVVDGDHQTARLMLDVHTERAPQSPAAHAESARSFDVVGDVTRACAHFRSLAELTPDVTEARVRAERCWALLLGGDAGAVPAEEEGALGQLTIEVICDGAAAECPSPVAVAPDGRVLSPWTPGTGKSSRQKVSFVKLRSGDYHILVLGGSPGAQGRVVLSGRHENSAFRFTGGGMHTVAKANVAFY